MKQGIPKLKRENKEDGNPCQEMLDRQGEPNDQWETQGIPIHLPTYYYLPTVAPGTTDSGKQAN